MSNERDKTPQHGDRRIVTKRYLLPTYEDGGWHWLDTKQSSEKFHEQDGWVSEWLFNAAQLWGAKLRTTDLPPEKLPPDSITDDEAKRKIYEVTEQCRVSCAEVVGIITSLAGEGHSLGSAVSMAKSEANNQANSTVFRPPQNPNWREPPTTSPPPPPPPPPPPRRVNHE